MKDGGERLATFPVCLCLTLSQKEISAIETIQTGLAVYPKEQVRFRTEKNLYCHSIEFRCYFRDPEEVEAFADSILYEFNLVRSPCLGAEEKRNPASLGEEAQLAMRYGQQEVKISTHKR